MNKKLFHLIPATLLCFSFACRSTSKKPEILPPTYSKEEIFSSNEEIIEKTPPTPPACVTQEGYWNTEEVDIHDVDESRKLIAITFDDTPSRHLESILSVFASFNEQNPDCKATATLFVNGGRIDEQNIHALYTANALGFELGNHTHSHADLTTLSTEKLREEIAKTDALLEKIDKKALHLLRAPYGKVSDLVKSTAPTPLIDWTIDTLDWTGATAEEIYERVWAGRFSGAIALLHDGYGNSVKALKKLLPALKEDGYQVVALSKMIKAHGCRFQKGKVYIRARKQK